MRWLVLGVACFAGCYNTAATRMESANSQVELTPPREASSADAPLSEAQLQELEQIRRRMPSEFRSRFDEKPLEFKSALRQVTGLEPFAIPEKTASESADFPNTLRQAARYLDTLAANMEDQRRFTEADEVRAVAQRLRDKCRTIDNSATVNSIPSE